MSAPVWTLEHHARFIAEQVRNRYDLGVETGNVLLALHRYAHTSVPHSDQYTCDDLYAESVKQWNNLIVENPPTPDREGNIVPTPK